MREKKKIPCSQLSGSVTIMHEEKIHRGFLAEWGETVEAISRCL